MRTVRAVSLVVAGALALWSPAARADSLCPDKADQAAANAQMKRAEDLERAGKAREAHRVAVEVSSDCVTDYRRFEALKKRTAGAVGAEEEKKGRFAEAFDWFERAQNVPEAGRMQRKLVAASPDDLNAVQRAIGFFVRHQDAAQEQALRAHALKNVEKALAAEEAQFALATKDSLHQLELARDWSRPAQAGEERIRARAAKRGDALAAEDGRRFLDLALQYYAAAEAPEKGRNVREKARTLARKHESKGEGEIAAEYYAIAGDSAKSTAVQKQTEASQQQAEEARQKNFKKEQKDLEKALGF